MVVERNNSLPFSLNPFKPHCVSATFQRNTKPVHARNNFEINRLNGGTCLY
mgnify:CR=1 FL=1